MQAFRQRAASVARRSRPLALHSPRTFASETDHHKPSTDHHDDHGHKDHHDEHHHDDHHHHGHNVEESLGLPFYLFAGAIPAGWLVYSVSRPGKDGEPNAITKMWKYFDYQTEMWETRNNLRTQMFEQAAHDKHLFLYSRPKSMHVELSYPEIFQHGSTFNVPAGSGVKLDHVVAHYRQQHLDEEERKAKKLAERGGSGSGSGSA